MFILYANEGCPYCLLLKFTLQSTNTPHHVVLVANNPIAEPGIKEVWKQKVGQELVNVPVLVTHKGDIIAGYEEEKIWNAIQSFHTERCNLELAKALAGQQAAGATAPATQQEQLVEATD